MNYERENGARAPIFFYEISKLLSSAFEIVLNHDFEWERERDNAVEKICAVYAKHTMKIKRKALPKQLSARWDKRIITLPNKQRRVYLRCKMDLLRMNIDYRQNFSDFLFLSSCHFVRHPEIERRMNEYFIPKNMTRKKCEMKFVNIRCMHVLRVHVWILIEYQYIHDFVCKRKQKVKRIEHLFQIKQWIRYQF